MSGRPRESTSPGGRDFKLRLICRRVELTRVPPILLNSSSSTTSLSYSSKTSSPRKPCPSSDPPSPPSPGLLPSLGFVEASPLYLPFELPHANPVSVPSSTPSTTLQLLQQAYQTSAETKIIGRITKTETFQTAKCVRSQNLPSLPLHISSLLLHTHSLLLDSSQAGADILLPASAPTAH